MEPALTDKKPLELPQSEEKLLRAPTFFEKYGWIKPVSILAILIITTILSSYLLRANNPSPDTVPITPSPTTPPQITTAADLFSDWKTFKSEWYEIPNQFTIKYPPNWSLEQWNYYGIHVINLYSFNNNGTSYQPGSQPKGESVIEIQSVPTNSNFSSLNDWCKQRILSGADTDANFETVYEFNIQNSQTVRMRYRSKSSADLNGEIVCIKAGLQNIEITTSPIDTQNQIDNFDQILSTFKFLDTTEITPKLSCRPRPACLDSVPRCMIPETLDMCPAPTRQQVYCTQDVKQCPDGSFVGRTGPNCEFAACPAQNLK